MVDSTLSDADLVVKIGDGDPRAEEELVQRFGRAVRIVLRRLLRNAPEAEDLFQETFCLAIQKIRGGELQNPERVSSYIVSLARNSAINHFRLQTRRRTDLDNETVERIAVAAPPQLRRVMAADRSALVRRLIGELATDRDRQLLLRFYLADDDKAAICEDLGLDSLHFNRVLHRARRRLKELYEQKKRDLGGLVALVLGPFLSGPGGRETGLGARMGGSGVR